MLTLDHITTESEEDNYEIPPIRLLKKIEGAATFDKKLSMLQQLNFKKL